MSYRAYGSEMVPAGGGGGYGDGYGGGGGGYGGGYGGSSPPRVVSPKKAQCPIYQIDFSAVASGKRIASTKRRVRWRFGFTNMDALRAGETGTACRGEEHDVTIVWSITSGKRQITMDGKEVHFSASRGSILDFSWSIRGNHVVKVVAHASPPLSATPGFRQYDMFVDGQSFFTMPKVYELGIKGGGGPGLSPRSGDGSRAYDLQRSGYVPTSADQEEEQLKRAIAASLEESREHLQNRGKLQEQAYNGGAPEPEPAADLLDFGSEPPAPAPAETQSMVHYQGETQQYAGAGSAMMSDAMSLTSAPPAYGNYGAPPPQQQWGSPPPSQYAPQPPAQNQYAPQPPAQNQYAPQPPAQNQYAPQPPAQNQYAPADQFAPQADDPFAPKPPPPPSHNDIANSILGAYGAPQQNGASSQGYQTPIASNMPAEHPPQQEAGQVPQLSMNAAFVAPEEGEPKSEVEDALSKLVNFDNINEPAEKEVKLTMKKEEERKKKNKTSALPPTGTGWIGSNATLSQIQEVKPTKPHKDPSEIMSTPPMLFSPGAVGAGALVIHGQGPPPLQRGFGVVGSGFGVGAQMGYGGMPQQQPPQGYYAQPPQGYYAQPPPQQQYNNY